MLWQVQCCLLVGWWLELSMSVELSQLFCRLKWRIKEWRKNHGDGGCIFGDSGRVGGYQWWWLVVVLGVVLVMVFLVVVVVVDHWWSWYYDDGGGKMKQSLLWRSVIVLVCNAAAASLNSQNLLNLSALSALLIPLHCSWWSMPLRSFVWECNTIFVSW